MPGGQFYTLSWDLVHIVAEAHHKHPIVNVTEDRLSSGSLYQAAARFDLVQLGDCRAFHVKDAFNRLNQEMVDLGPINCAAINRYKMKTDEMYL